MHSIIMIFYNTSYYITVVLATIGSIHSAMESSTTPTSPLFPSFFSLLLPMISPAR